MGTQKAMCQTPKGSLRHYSQLPRVAQPKYPPPEQRDGQSRCGMYTGAGDSPQLLKASTALIHATTQVNLVYFKYNKYCMIRLIWLPRVINQIQRGSRRMFSSSFCVGCLCL